MSFLNTKRKTSGVVPAVTVHVKIQTPDTVVWEGEADSISSANSAGPFDILPDHANIITIIENAPIEIISAAGNRNFTFEKAILRLQDNALTVYANIQSKTKSEASTKQANA